ncbi:MAG: ATP cone domain-containing protein [Patescibacteria group bacterium]
MRIKKSDGSLEPFNPEKLMASLVRSGAAPEAAADIATHIEGELKDEMPTSHIYRHAFELLRRQTKPVAISYSLRHAIAELGPSGFPFEKFVAELYKASGYETVTGVIVQGKCVPHEMDVVAWKGDELIFIEAKFHNEFDLKSDLKVALYVKARFDDLRGREYEFGGKTRKLSHALLVTNTKFTSTAIDYGVCAGLSMIGWNYPAKGNLHHMIEGAGLHPVTAISGLSNVEKRDLLASGKVLCRSINTESALKTAGIRAEKIPGILEEIKLVC